MQQKTLDIEEKSLEKRKEKLFRLKKVVFLQSEKKESQYLT